jgi:LPS O-antigen subunit length determinant protein (WzzB/FepE family)
MEFLASYWFIIVIAIAIGAVIGVAVYNFVNKPTNEQLAKIKEWLLYAVTEAEKELGSGTGQIKLRYVYDKFVTKFSYLAKIVSFDTFSTLVDEALDKFKTMLESNDDLNNYIKGE